MNELVYWIWLSLSLNAGSRAFGKLISRHKSPKEIYELSEEELKREIGSKSSSYKGLMRKDLRAAERVLSFCQTKGVGILTYNDDNFPIAYREITNPPAVLYYRGKLPKFNEECFVSVVGTRRLTDYGRRNAYSISYDLARSGITVVSGMAVGIDGVSLGGALAAGGKTVAIIASGIDVCYPKSHLTLARAIVEEGCVMTEYPPSTRPFRANFPRRNRLISALSCATVVVEGEIGSGSLITARNARKQGKVIYALPGNVDVKTSDAANALIKNGAKLLIDAGDIIEDFQYKYLGKINPFKISEPPLVKIREAMVKYRVSCVAAGDSIFNPFARVKKEKQKKRAGKEAASEVMADSPSVAAMAEVRFPEGFNKKAIEIYKMIPEDKPCGVDMLVGENYSIREVMTALTTLEMGGFIELLPGEMVRRKIN